MEQPNLAVFTQFVHAPDGLNLQRQPCEVGHAQLAINIPELVVLLPRPPTLLPAPHGLPLVSHHNLGIGLELAPEAHAHSLRILSGVAEQVGERHGLLIDSHTNILELLPRNDDDEGEQYGIQRSHHLELSPRHLVVRFEHLGWHEPADEEETDYR